MKFKKCIAVIVTAALISVSVISGIPAVAPVKTAKAELLTDETGQKYEILTGNGWWNNTPASQKYIVTGGAEVHLTIKALVDVTLNVELVQYNGGRYITTGSNNDAWYHNASGSEGTPSHTVGSAYNFGLNKLVSGHTYDITVIRKDDNSAGTSDYQIIYYDATADADYITYTAEGTNLTEEVIVHVLAQEGTFELRPGDGCKLLLNHGTDREKAVSKDEVNNDPPADYVIPEGLVQDAKDKKYEAYFPKDSIQTVSITLPENNLNYLLQNSAGKPSVMTTSVTIGDTTVGYAGLKTKGNYTLTQTVGSTSDRFSFTLNFGKYIKKKQYGAKQNFFGCNKISFNNCFFDKTILKEYNSMRLMDEMGIPTPQYSIAKLYINGEYYGVYFMVEAMDGAIIERYQNVDSKDVSDYLTKPSYTNMTYYFDMENCVNADGEFTMDALKEKGLLFYDEEKDVYTAAGTLTNYNSLWEGDDETLQDVAETLPVVLTWNRRVQLLSNGKDFNGNSIDVNSESYLKLLDSVMDTDETVKYFATHSFIIQMDNMFTWGQNFGLYVDNDGRSLMVPWDYDLAWGADFHPDNAEDVANWDIEKLYPDNFDNYGRVSASNVYSRTPVFNAIYQNDELMKKFRAYVDDCAKIVSMGGTVSDGKTYEPGRFAGAISTYYPQITAAAEVADMPEHVYYLNNYTQPDGAKQGIPELKKLIVMRSVGVWFQTHGLEANVTGYGCDLKKTGTANSGIKNTPSTSGSITAVDADTGIFATATYGTGSGGARITVKQCAKSDPLYQEISGKLGPDITVYQIKNEKTPTSDYTLYIPVSPEKSGVRIYSYVSGGSETRLKVKAYDNVYSVSASDISCIVVSAGNKPDDFNNNDSDIPDSEISDSSDNQNGTDDTPSTVKKLSSPKIKTLKNTGKKKMTVLWKKVSGANGYQIRYKQSGKKEKTVTVKGGASTKKVISGLKKGKKYTVKVRAYKAVSGKRMYSGWSAKKTVKIAK